MGIMLLDNFNVDDATALPSRGYALHSAAWVTSSIISFSDKGVTRTSLQIAYDVAASGGSILAQLMKIPVPSTKSAYVSFRIRLSNPSGSTTVPTDFFLGLMTNYTSSGNTVFWQWRQSRISTTSGGLNAAPNGPGYARAWEKWVKVEVYRAANGALQVWVDDLILTTPLNSITAPPDNFFYLVGGRTAVRGAVALVQVTDMVVVDPDTPGLKYRPGAAARVLGVPTAADVVAEWVADPAATGPHHSIVASYPSSVTAAHTLSATSIGQREQYQTGNMPAVFGSQVIAVGADMLLSNAGGISGALAVEFDAGAGPVENAAVAMPSASGFQFRPVYMEKKPDGSNWTIADFPGIKAGYSLKA